VGLERELEATREAATRREVAVRTRVAARERALAQRTEASETRAEDAVQAKLAAEARAGEALGSAAEKEQEVAQLRQILRQIAGSAAAIKGEAKRSVTEAAAHSMAITERLQVTVRQAHSERHRLRSITADLQEEVNRAKGHTKRERLRVAQLEAQLQASKTRNQRLTAQVQDTTRRLEGQREITSDVIRAANTRDADSLSDAPSFRASGAPLQGWDTIEIFAQPHGTEMLHADERVTIDGPDRPARPVLSAKRRDDEASDLLSALPGRSRYPALDDESRLGESALSLQDVSLSQLADSADGNDVTIAGENGAMRTADSDTLGLSGAMADAEAALRRGSTIDASASKRSGGQR
jgi:hypothetical protein